MRKKCRLMPALLGALTLLSVLGCTEADDKPVNVSYSEDIHPILLSRCVMCHSSENNNGGVNLESYSGIFSSISMDSGDGIVLPGDPHNSLLYDVISTDDLSRRMPLGGSELKQDDQDLIYVWIQEGAVEN